MTREEAIIRLKDGEPFSEINDTEWNDALNMAIKALEQEPCDCISRKSLKHKLQKHHDFFVNAYGGFSNLPPNDKSRVDEITNCIAMVVNEPNIQSKTGHWILDNKNLFASTVYCSECGEVVYVGDCGNYCPNCGVKMEVE